MSRRHLRIRQSFGDKVIRFSRDTSIAQLRELWLTEAVNAYRWQQRENQRTAAEAVQQRIVQHA